MGIMSSFEKFFVNRASERNARGFLEMIEEGVTIPSGKSILELGADKGALSYSLYKKLAPVVRNAELYGFVHQHEHR